MSFSIVEERRTDMNNNRNPVRIVIVFTMFILICVGVFFYLSNRSEDNNEENSNPKVMTAVQEALSRNLETNYPPTPKELVKYYSEITRCFYGEKYTEDELSELAVKSRKLFDDELYATQTDEQYLMALQLDIESYKEENKVISSYSVSSSTDVNEYYYDGYDWAQLYCIYSVRIGTQIAPVQERFLLRKDEQGHWKILGWQLVEDEEQE